MKLSVQRAREAIKTLNSVFTPLNDFTEAELDQILTEQSQEMQADLNLLSSSRAPNPPDRLLDAIRDESLEAGLISIAKNKNVAEAVHFLGSVLDCTRRLFELSPQAPDASPTTLLAAIYIATILDRSKDAQYLASLRSYQMKKYEDEEFEADAVVMGYIIAIQLFVLGKEKQARQVAYDNLDIYSNRKERFVKHFLLYTKTLLTLLDQKCTEFDNA